MKSRGDNQNPRFRQVEIVIKDQGNDEEVEEEIITNTSADVMNQLCKYIYASETTQRPTTQAILSHIYSLNNRFMTIILMPEI